MILICNHSPQLPEYFTMLAMRVKIKTMTMKQAFLVFFALAFMLTSSASASMMCCWDGMENTQEQSQNSDMPMPCHDNDGMMEDSSDHMDMDESDTKTPASTGCCSDMSSCETPIIHGVNTVTMQYDIALQNINVIPISGLTSNLTIPPIPPPRFLL